jgi:hypothetical protein
VLATEQQIIPTASAIATRLGASSSGHQLEQADLRSLYLANQNLAPVEIKRELWAKLLTTALGTQFHANDHELFVNHTLLVATADAIAHAVLGFPITELTPATLLGANCSRGEPRFLESSNMISLTGHLTVASQVAGGSQVWPVGWHNLTGLRRPMT